MKTPAEIATPQVPGLKPNIGIPSGVRVERQPERGINSSNQTGGYVDPRRFGWKSQ